MDVDQLNQPLTSITGYAAGVKRLLERSGQPDARQVPVGRFGEAQHSRAAVSHGPHGATNRFARAVGGVAGQGHARIVCHRQAHRLPRSTPVDGLRYGRIPSRLRDGAGSWWESSTVAPL